MYIDTADSLPLPGTLVFRAQVHHMSTMTYTLCTATLLRGESSRYPSTTTRTRPLGHSCRCSTRLSPAPCVFLVNHKSTPRTVTDSSTLDSSALVSIASGHFRPHCFIRMPAWRVKCDHSSMSALLHLFIIPLAGEAVSVKSYMYLLIYMQQKLRRNRDLKVDLNRDKTMRR
jgi:hypothetical protein